MTFNSYLNIYYSKDINNTYYNSGISPNADYPQRLCQYLFQKFQMRKGDKLLDIGCGRGEYLEGFKKLGLDVFGLDREDASPAHTKELNITSRIDIETETFPFENNTFDIVFSKSVVAHLWRPDSYIKEIHRVLKPGGKIIITTPDWRSQMYIFYDDFTKVHPYTQIALEKLLKIYNFHNVKTEIFYTKPIFWEYPCLKIIARFFQLLGPVKKIHKNQFIRWSRELMILGNGTK